MSNTIQIRDNQGQAVYPITDESLVIGLNERFQQMTNRSYTITWDGTAAPTVANIPAGVVVTYNGTNYTGTLAASENTFNYIYLVKNGNNYDQYVTSSGAGTYTWVFMGTTEIDLSDYATKNEINQLGQEVTAEIYQKIDLLTLLTNAGFVRYNNGTIASGTTYPNSRYTSPIQVYKGDIIYIKANVGTPSVSVVSRSKTSTSTTFTPVLQGANSVQEYRYVCTEDEYLVISTYSYSNIASGVWLLLRNKTANTILSSADKFKYFGNNVWASNPSGSGSTLDNFLDFDLSLKRRTVYECIRSARFNGLDSSVKRTLYILWNGYQSKFRVAISKYTASGWVSEYDSQSIDVSTINPEHNGVLDISLGNGAVELVVDTAIFGYLSTSRILNPTGNNEPELIFSKNCYFEAGESSGSEKTCVPRIYPNALLPCISFEFDDNDDNDRDVISLFDELGVRCNFAFIASADNIAAKGAEYLGYHRRGYGICSHSVDSAIFNTTNYNRTTALAALQTSKQRLESLGIVVNGFVSPSSQMASDFFDLVEDTYGYAFTETDGYSGKRNGSPCRQSRQSMQSATLDYLKGRIDVAITYGYNFTFYGHSADFGTTYSGEEWNLTKLRAIVEYAIAKRDAGQIFIGNSDECMTYFYGERLYNRHFSGACGTIQPKNRYHYYLHNVTSATIAYSANLPAECEIMLETDASYTSGITFGSGYKFASVPTFGAGETWYIKIVQGCVIATKMI